MPIRIDERLTAVASLVGRGRVADIGCDHGKLGYYLIGTDRATFVIATDISEGSLKKARELAFDNGVSDIMQTRLGDGLDPVESGEVDTVVIAGLGGDVIAGILARARMKGKKFAHYVLSPNTHAERVREELANCAHIIEKDFLVECGGKKYTVMSTSEGVEVLDELQLLFGKFYAESEAFKKDAETELNYKEKLLAAHPSPELEKRVCLLKKALDNVKSL